MDVSSVDLFQSWTVGDHTTSSMLPHHVSVKDDLKAFFLDIFVQTVDGMSVYYSLALIVVGCICNPLSFVVLSRRTFRDSSTSSYLKFLSLMDLGAILTGFTRFFVDRAFGVNLRKDVISCRMNLFFAGLFLYSSSWTLVVVTVERMISVVWPHRVHLLCSRKNVRMVLCLVVLGNIIFYLPFSMLTENVAISNPVTNRTSFRHCVMKTDAFTMTMIFTIATVHLTFLPCLIIIMLNIIIVYGVVKSRRRVSKATLKERGGSAVVPAHSKTVIDKVASRSETSLADLVSSPSISGQQEVKVERSSASTRSRKETSLTLTLVCVSTSFVVCTFPNAAYGHNLFYLSGQEKQPAELALADLLDILMYTNNSLNFALYCITGSWFRAEVKATLREMGMCLLNKHKKL